MDSHNDAAAGITDGGFFTTRCHGGPHSAGGRGRAALKMERTRLRDLLTQNFRNGKTDLSRV